MMEVLSRWLVQQPVHIALGFVAVWALGRLTVLRTLPRAWVPALLWAAYAAWEALVLMKTPEADIRVDLLLIWPLLGVAMLWAGYRAASGWWSVSRNRR